MTREQYQKHKEAIQWFYEQPEGTEIWFYDIECIYSEHPTWQFTSDPSWLVDHKYVINDELSEFRRAVADGKQLQILNKLGNKPTWDDRYYDNPNTLERYHEFRIKSDKPKFKLGDWVKNNEYGLFQITPSNIGSCNDINNHVGRFKTEHWELRPGEWCWFWGDSKEPLLGQFKYMDSDFNHLYVVNLPNRHNVYTFRYCEPFIGSVPTVLQ